MKRLFDLVLATLVEIVLMIPVLLVAVLARLTSPDPALYCSDRFCHPNGWGLAQSALIAQLVGLGDGSFVKRGSEGSRADLPWLSFHAGQCRDVCATK